MTYQDDGVEARVLAEDGVCALLTIEHSVDVNLDFAQVLLEDLVKCQYAQVNDEG